MATELPEDPTERTREDLLREIKSVRELMQEKIAVHAAVCQERITAVQQVGVEHNASVERQLIFLESQRQEQKQDTKQAVDAALAAAKEAVNITATNTKEQIAALQTSFSTEMKALSEKLDDVKNSVTANASAIQGRQEGRQGFSDTLKLGIAMIGSVVLLIGFFISQRGGV